ncbi:MAG: adenosylcobinamide-GDP ribazoletransferase [Bacteroides sp.]
MNVLAAFIFFTRLPFWRIHEVPAHCFKHVVPYWPLTGWLTGGIMAGVAWLASLMLPLHVAVLLALFSRLLVTGALHEDGLADFFDGFGGGTTRERTLAIMKDSHIGSYGVIALIGYFLLVWALLTALPLPVLCVVLFTGDVWAKFVAAQIINFLPYARKEADSKAKVVYNRMSVAERVLAFLFGITPLCLWFPMQPLWAAGLPIVTFAGLCLLMKRKLQGYTGDCCGALFLLCELSFYVGVVFTYTLWN